MKKSIILAFFATATILACNNDKEPVKDGDSATAKETGTFTTAESDGSGTFTIDGKTFTGKVSTQKFANNQFSVVCQQDEPLTLFQITFKDESDAKSAGSFKPSSSFMTIDPGTAYLSVSNDVEFRTTSKSTGTMELSGNTITVKDMTLSNTGDDKTVTVSGTIKF